MLCRSTTQQPNQHVSRVPDARPATAPDKSEPAKGCFHCFWRTEENTTHKEPTEHEQPHPQDQPSPAIH